MDTNTPMSIGAYADNTLVMSGRIDEVVLYKRILTPTERTWLHNNGIAQAYIDLQPVNPGTSGLVSWWSLNEASGTRNDSHSTNHLTDNNAVPSAAGLKGNSAAFVTAGLESLSIADNASISTG